MTFTIHTKYNQRDAPSKATYSGATKAIYIYIYIHIYHEYIYIFIFTTNNGMEIQIQFISRFKISGVPINHLVSWQIIKSGKNILRPITNFQVTFAGELQQHNR